MTETELVAYCDSQGVLYKYRVKGLQVMDLSLLPDAMRDACDDAGYLIKASTDPEPQPEGAMIADSAETVSEPPKGKLPADFPGHAALEAAGIHTYGQLLKIDDLKEIPGIGQATAAKISEALEG